MLKHQFVISCVAYDVIKIAGHGHVLSTCQHHSLIIICRMDCSHIYGDCHGKIT